MNTNRLFLLIAASLMTGAVCAVTAMADVHHPEAYEQLTAVEMQAGSTPRLAHGFSDLSSNERRFGERLPMQLEGAMKKVKATKYTPRQKQKFRKSL